MKTIIPKPKTFHFWNSAPSVDDLISIIDYIPHAAFIFDPERSQIVFGNVNLLRLTAFTRYELTKLSLKDLLHISCDENEFFSENNYQHPFEGEIFTRYQQLIPVSITAFPLDENQNWILITLETKTNKKIQDTTEHRAFMLEKTLENIKNQHSPLNKGAVIEIFLRTCAELSKNSIFSLYEVQLEQQNPIRFIKVGSSSNENIFPSCISIRDIAPYYDPFYWQKGKQNPPEMLLLSRKHQINSLSSLPIKNAEALFGVLFIASQKSRIEDNIIASLYSLTNILSLHYPLWKALNSAVCECEGLRRKSAIQNKIVENVQDGVILLSEDSTILLMNPAAEHIFGYLSHETIGQPIQDILIGTANLTTALQLAKEGIETPNLGNIFLHRRNGQAFNAFLQVIPVLEDEYHLGTIIIVRDLSNYHEIKMRTQQLEQRALLGELTAIFSHEIRNPINNISLALQTMSKELGQSNPYFAYIESIQDELDRLVNLMKTVLSFSKSSAYNMVEMDIVQLIESVLLRWQTFLAKQKVKAHFQRELPAAYIMGHAQALEQVFNNLISNALRAMEGLPDGTLHIKIEQIQPDDHQACIQITISDTGIGIPQEHLEHIFQPFFTTDHYNGTGLGLTITERIVIAHKGKIQVKSFPSGGSVFVITLPAIHPKNL